MKKNAVAMLLVVLAMVTFAANLAGAEENFKKTTPRAWGMTVEEINPAEYNPPPQRPNRLKSFSGYPFEPGESFNEVGLTAGGYKNSDDLRGGYFLCEANHWREWKNAGRNISLLGAFVMYEPGEVNDYKWRKIKLMYQPAWYEIMDDHETVHILLKPRIGISINRGTEEENNLSYGIYSEMDRIFNPLNRVGIILDSLFEARKAGKDGYVNPRVFYERGWANGNTAMLSVGPIWHVSPDDTTTGITPALSLRIPLNNDLAVQVALTADITDENKTYGGYLSITWNDITHIFQKK